LDRKTAPLPDGGGAVGVSKSLAEFAPAGANKVSILFFPAACTSGKTLYGSQVWILYAIGVQNMRAASRSSLSKKALAFFDSLTAPLPDGSGAV